jgi:arsenate reductase
MTRKEAVATLGALAQETRLGILRLLIQRGSEGMASGELGARLKLSSPTLSFHLNHLKYAGLVTSRRESSFIIYGARHRTIDNLIEYLSHKCRNASADGAYQDGLDSVVVPPRTLNVLFLCTHNSARSIMAECAINRWGAGKFNGFSAGSHPRGTVHPSALRVLNALGYETDHLRSKHWDEFSEPTGPTLDFVFTLCDRAAAEVCPAWPGQPITAHWGVKDPAAFMGSDAATRRAFLLTYRELEQRIRIFTSLPIETLERFALQRWATEIGKLPLAA